MNETENAEDVEEETLPGDEDEPDITNFSSFMRYLKSQAISVARQFLCSWSVLIFPVLGALYEAIPMTIPYSFEILDEKGKVDKAATVHAHYTAYLADFTVVKTIGLLMAGIFLYLIGRKYTIIIANLLHLAGLLYLYGAGVEKKLHYKMLIVLVGLDDFCYVVYFIYVAEITGPAFRAFVMGLYFFNDAWSQELSNAARHEHTVNRMIRNYAIVTCVSFLLAIILPETPFWSALKGNAEKAEGIFIWLKAGNTNRIEFNQMIASAENIRENRRTIKPLLSRTFAVGLIFSICIVICTFNPCIVLQPFLNDFYYPSDKDLTEEVYLELRSLLHAAVSVELQYRFFGALMFLLLSPIAPRKVIYFVSYAFGIIIIAAIVLKLERFRLLVQLVSYCALAPRLGVLPMSMILPVEIYPASLREVGVIITVILNRAARYFTQLSWVKTRKNFPKTGVLRGTSYFSYFGSFIGIVFIMVFMPETWRTNIYELKELNFYLPWRRRKKSSLGEGESAAVEGVDAAVEGERVEDESAAVEGVNAEDESAESESAADQGPADKDRGTAEE